MDWKNFNIDNKLAFIDNFQFLISSLDSLKLIKHNFKFKRKITKQRKVLYIVCWQVKILAAKVELELISDADMFSVVEKDMRGGVSCTSKRYSKVKIKYLKFYDPKQESKHYIYRRK